LSVVHGIVTQHNGHILAESAPNKTANCFNMKAQRHKDTKEGVFSWASRTSCFNGFVGRPEARADLLASPCYNYRSVRIPPHPHAIDSRRQRPERGTAANEPIRWNPMDDIKQVYEQIKQRRDVLEGYL
jgi:hypothetical protein